MFNPYFSQSLIKGEHAPQLGTRTAPPVPDADQGDSIATILADSFSGAFKWTFYFILVTVIGLTVDYYYRPHGYIVSLGMTFLVTFLALFVLQIIERSNLFGGDSRQQAESMMHQQRLRSMFSAGV